MSAAVDILDFFQKHPDVVRSVRTHSRMFSSWELGYTWNAALTIGDEVEYIWPIPWNYKVKWWYLYFRYVTLAAHVAYGVCIAYLTSNRPPGSTCRAWFLFMTATAAFSKTQIELMLAMRAYVLFDRRPWVLHFLCLLCTVELTSDVTGAVYTMPMAAFEQACIIVDIPWEGRSFMVVCPIIQTCLVGMILFKSFLAIRAGWGRTPLVSLLIREGFTTYFVLMGLFVLLVFMCSYKGIQGVSVIMYRVGMKHRLGGQSRSGSDSGALFTSEIELSTRSGET
ncbi:hypothetical protein F5I97DRAFT_1437879 [Phlebopus sp. FC_14]|nr:hypothetical protein F5I97DRAFT_1437879 [Phlebopus sp. FC_14]